MKIQLSKLNYMNCELYWQLIEKLFMNLNISAEKLLISKIKINLNLELMLISRIDEVWSDAIIWDHEYQ